MNGTGMRADRREVIILNKNGLMRTLTFIVQI